VTSPDYSAVVRFRDLGETSRRLPAAVGGIVLIGACIGMSVRARLGLAPWDVFHKGLANRSGVSLGLVIVLVGLVVMIAWIPLRQRVGVGTIINVAVVGPVANASLHVLPSPQALVPRIALLLGALVGFGVGGGLYIGAALGPGPRDGLMTAISARGLAVWKVRTVMEVSVFAIGWLLGGSVGIGTVVLAFGQGPITHWALERFHLPIHTATEAHGE
jgi:uncharacterized membrane protein YczE